LNQNQKTIGKFLFTGDWPEEILPTIEALSQEFQWLVPLWCHVVTVTWRPDIDAAMDCELEADYRRFRLRVGADFFDDSPDHRRQCFIHELLHGFILPLESYATDSVERLLPDDDDNRLKDVILEEIRERNEQVTEDLAFCLNQWLANHKTTP
jgi:hypothetical protein